MGASQSTQSSTQTLNPTPSNNTSSNTHELPPGHPSPPAGVDKCPVDHTSRQKWSELASSSSSTTNIHTNSPATPPATSLSSLFGKSKPQPEKLSTEKEISSIPRGALEEGSKDGDKWIYPSEAQFYNALVRKHVSGKEGENSSTASHGHAGSTNQEGLGDVELDAEGKAVTNGNVVKLPQKKDMKVVVPIHNAVNERTWASILAWEAGRGGNSCGGVRLVSFQGDSRKLSPKARWNILLGYQRPFDRHDWIIDRCGTKVRYIIDYYTGKVGGSDGGPVSFYIDARPALDSWEGWKLRAGKLFGR